VAYHLNKTLCNIRDRLHRILGVSFRPAILTRIARQYQSPGRYYHDIGHLSMLFENYDLVEDHIDHKKAVQLAILYHDIVYHTDRSDNEFASSEMLMSDIAGLVDNKTLQMANFMIQSTCGHQSVDDLDTRYFLDIDLSPLGQDPVIWANLNNAVRMEFDWVPKDRYVRGRGKVLSQFYHRPRIYQTQFFYDRYEKAARQNIKWTLENL